ncbi:MAG TPA: preprotein translocase subunit SecG [Acidobacteriota bacterium]|nr:preprotein translocase subunit SecG [Acidobacteriota bacterium]
MLFYVAITLHVIACVILVLVVLLQSGKGADLAGAFGGGSTQTAFGSRGPASFLTRITTVVAIIFMITSISLTTVASNRKEARSVLEATETQTGEPAGDRQEAKSDITEPIPTPEQIRRIREGYEAKQSAEPDQDR